MKSRKKALAHKAMLSRLMEEDCIWPEWVSNQYGPPGWYARMQNAHPGFAPHSNVIRIDYSMDDAILLGELWENVPGNVDQYRRERAEAHLRDMAAIRAHQATP